MKLDLLCGVILSLSALNSVLCSEYHGEPVYESVEEWKLWKSVHSKTYASSLEELEKHIVWLSNKAYIDQHNINANKYSYKVKLNHFADLTDKEYHEQYLSSYKRPDWNKVRKASYVRVYNPPKVSSWPDSMDWRTRGAVTKIKYQAGCGASYAFASTGALESVYSLTYDRSAENLSEQNLIDCSVPEGNNGCKGGNMYNSFTYIIFNDGIDTANSYRYQGMQKTCNFSSKYVGAMMSGIIAINTGSESDLQAALTYAGPVAAAVDAKSTGFRFYSGGIFSSSLCSSYNLNHAMLVVGYGTSYDNGIAKEYWILKNSWGEEWGKDGYIWMTRNQYNQCGIATDCSYPSL